VSLDGRLIDIASIKQAQNLVQKAEQIAESNPLHDGMSGGAPGAAGCFLRDRSGGEWQNRLSFLREAVLESAMHNFLDFEKPIAELEGKIEELRHLTGNASSTSPTRSASFSPRSRSCCRRLTRS
jgi:hypothetical protein